MFSTSTILARSQQGKYLQSAFECRSVWNSMGLRITNRQTNKWTSGKLIWNKVRLIRQCKFCFQLSLPHCSSSMKHVVIVTSCEYFQHSTNFPTFSPLFLRHHRCNPFRLTCRYWSDLSWSQGQLCTAQGSNGFTMQLPQWKPQGMEHTPHHAVPTLCQAYLNGLESCQGVEITKVSMGVNFGQVFSLILF